MQGDEGETGTRAVRIYGHGRLRSKETARSRRGHERRAVRTVRAPTSSFRLSMLRLAPLLLLLALLAGCRSAEAPAPSPSDDPSPAVTRPAPSADRVTERVLAANLDQILAYADSVESALRPVPLLTPRQKRDFDRYDNDAHLVVARRLGVPQPVTGEMRDRLLTEGRLVRLDDSAFWTVRELDHSTALVTPDALALLTEIGERFQARLGDLGVPPLRFEITSVLRTADDQARLRRTNRNATRGVTTHQFGTTVDIAYSSFRAPQTPALDLDAGEAPELEPYLRQIEALAAETGAARMSRELQAELGRVLKAMQDEGKVMVTLEVRQPVFHITVAQRYD